MSDSSIVHQDSRVDKPVDSRASKHQDSRSHVVGYGISDYKQLIREVLAENPGEFRGKDGVDGKSDVPGVQGAPGRDAKIEIGVVVAGEKPAARIRVVDGVHLLDLVLPKGDRGANSIVPGPAGATGATGATGPQGAQGHDGERGDKGERGQKGEPGERGRDGVDGKRGERGHQGERGATGPAPSDEFLFEIVEKVVSAVLTEKLGHNVVHATHAKLRQAFAEARAKCLPRNIQALNALIEEVEQHLTHQPEPAPVQEQAPAVAAPESKTPEPVEEKKKGWFFGR